MTATRRRTRLVGEPIQKGTSRRSRIANVSRTRERGGGRPGSCPSHCASLLGQTVRRRAEDLGRVRPPMLTPLHAPEPLRLARRLVQALALPEGYHTVRRAVREEHGAAGPADLCFVVHPVVDDVAA